MIGKVPGGHPLTRHSAGVDIARGLRNKMLSMGLQNAELQEFMSGD
jgi:hypothetical protein